MDAGQVRTRDITLMLALDATMTNEHMAAGAGESMTVQQLSLGNMSEA